MTKLHLATVQWASLPDINEVEPLSDRDYEVLAELRSVLLKHGRTHRFGVALLHKHFDLADDEVLMETTNVDVRRSILAVEKLGDLSNTIETMWMFSDDPSPGLVTVCVPVCHYDRGHKRMHQRQGK